MYDVFISFRGMDTRRSFVNPLFHALSRNKISTFIHREFSSEDKISSSIFRLIGSSTIFVIIFCENYAGSKRCFMELPYIMKGQRSNGFIHQKVVTVFHGVDPSDVRNQTGKFGAAHARLEERLRKEKTMDLDEIRWDLDGIRWDLDEIRCAFKEASGISGWLTSLGDNSDLVESIVVDIRNKLDQVRLRLNHDASLVGIASHVERIETLLRLDSPDLRVVGIYGPGGVGKTTITKAVTDHISARFHVLHLDNNMVSPDEIVSHIDVGKCQHKKILIVLDDFGKQDLVATLSHCRSLSGVSKILVITRDAQMLRNVADEAYGVEGLPRYDASQLFSLNAFNQNNEPTEGISQIPVSESVLDAADGNPLALVVLGCSLFGMSSEEKLQWLHEFNRLKDKPNYSDVQSLLRKEPNYDVQNVLRISYDTLNDNEKKIFLEIARYFIRKDLKDVLRCYGNRVVPIVSKLKEKSLITMSSNKIGMHDLLREMAYSIIDDGNRRRVYRWSPEVVLNYVFPLTNLVLESVVLTLEIIGSAKKPLYSLIALIVALSAMMVFLGELVYRGRHRNITLKWNGRGWWEMKRQPLDNRPFLSWSDAFSFLCAICQLVSTTVGYIYSRKHKGNPFRLSLVSLIYIICMGASHIVNKSIDDDLSMKRNE